MTHKPIRIHDITLFFPHKTCFTGFSTQVPYGSRITVIGRNGSGKSTLLTALAGDKSHIEGDILIPADVRVGYVPQVIEEFAFLSGGQRLNQAITEALKEQPNLLLLDEPTNHLDRHNRQSLLRMLYNFSGTLIIASHDAELLRNYVDTIWHIEPGYANSSGYSDGKINIFSGKYDDYMQERRNKRASIEQEIHRLARQKRDTHHALLKEQERAKKSDLRGEKSIRERKWPTIVSDEKARRAIETSGRKKAAIAHRKQDLSMQLQELRLPEVVVPKFSLACRDTSVATLVHVHDGSAGYRPEEVILREISLNIGPQERIAIIGDNASGKSTLIKAIMADANVIRTGYWQTPRQEEIGYLDQHYGTLSLHKSVLELLAELRPELDHAALRRHLNDFLFRKNEEVYATAAQLSGGKKARLSLALIAAKPPKLLILDELTNNLDMETNEHVTQVLCAYPGALIVISHDEDFLQNIGVESKYYISDGRLHL